MTSEILAIVNEVPLAHWKVEAGLNLRQAMLVNGTLFNSEAWHGVTKKDIILLEKVDEALLRGLLTAHSKVPLEALYLETKSIPLRFIVASRRLMYLHNILQKDEDELVRRVYEAQRMDPSPGDFVELVKEDMDTLGIIMTDQEIGVMQKERFRKQVKEKVLNTAFAYLKNIKQGHSKMENVVYSNFEISSYLSSPLFNTESRSLLLGLRTRTVSGVRKDFSGLYPDMLCPLGCGQDSSLPNILTCSVLKSHHTSQNISSSDVKYEDIFSPDITKQKQLT